MIAEFYRFMFDYSDLKGLDAGIRGTAPDVAWIVDVAGPDGGPVWRGAWALTLYLRRGSKHRAIAWRLATAGRSRCVGLGVALRMSYETDCKFPDQAPDQNPARSG